MKTKPTYEELKIRVKELEQRESECQQLAKDLQKGAERFKYLTENSTDWIWEFDENEIFTYASKAIKNILGYTPEEVLGKSAFDLIPSPECEKIKEEFASLKEERASFANLLNVNQHKNGSLVNLESSGVPIIDSKGIFHGYRGIDRDISERKRSEEMLRESEAHLRTLIQTLPDLVWLKDPEGVYLGCNRKFERFFGAKEEEIIGKTDYDFVEKEIADSFRENDKLAMALSGLSINEEEIDYADDGHREKIEVIKTPMYDVNGELVGILGVGRDISDRKRLEKALQEGLETYQTAINTPAMGFWAVNVHGRLMEVNDAYVRQSGYSREELLQMHIQDLESKQMPDEIKANIATLSEAGSGRFRTKHRRKDGTIWPLEVVTTFSQIQGGRFFAFLEDITDKIEQERLLELSSLVIETMSQAVVVTDANNDIISINPAVTRISGYSIEEVRGKNPRIFASGRHDQAFYAQMWETINTKGFWEGEIWDRRKNGEVYPKWLNVNVINDSEGIADRYFSVFSDITERKKTEETIWKQANFDPLTGVANRILFQNRLQQALNDRSRNGAKLAVIFFDLDHFKDINDTLGHAAGDEVLVQVTKRLKERSRKSDLVARLGGDEFTLLITDFREPEQIGSLAEGILNMLKEAIPTKDTEVHVGASIGIALYPDDGTTSEELVKSADLAMYQAKKNGKNNFQFFRPEMNDKAKYRLTMIQELHNAFENKVFQLYYQPKIRLADLKVVGMEALIRWPKKDGQMVFPDEFIPCAEETGLIIPIGSWVLAEACHQVKYWNQRFGTRLKVAVNLSARQFNVKTLLGDILEVLKEKILLSDFLELEITESILMDDVEEAIRLMTSIRENGISIAIDDFGTGYSSLSYLKRFPITTLKIDKSFVCNLTEDSEDASIVASTITLAKSLGLDVVAEGVETAEQLQFLKDNECDYVQGYHIAKPMPAEEFELYLDANRVKLI